MSIPVTITLAVAWLLALLVNTYSIALVANGKARLQAEGGSLAPGVVARLKRSQKIAKVSMVVSTPACIALMVGLILRFLPPASSSLAAQFVLMLISLADMCWFVYMTAAAVRWRMGLSVMWPLGWPRWGF